jgi:copper resistance protein B
MIRRALLALASLMIVAPAAAREAGHSHGHGQTPAGAQVPDDYVADRFYDPAAMAHAREMARMEMGAMRFSKVMLNLAEYRASAKGDGYHWDGEAWFGGDDNRLVLRSEGEGATSGGLESAEVQALYSRAVGRYTDVRAGLRQDFSPHARTYLAVGAASLLPYWFEIDGSAFLSTEGELLARAEGSYDLRLFQRVVLQPRAELNFAARNSPETRTGQGLSNAELGLRLRYEIRREFAPYIGVSWERRLGRTADYARDEGEPVEATSFVMGLRAWF